MNVTYRKLLMLEDKFCSKVQNSEKERNEFCTKDMALCSNVAELLSILRKLSD